MSNQHPWKLTIDAVGSHDTHDGDKFATTKRSVGASKSTAFATASIEFPFSFGRYEVLEMLGEGAMGSVYLARDTRLDRKVAIKIPKLDENSDRVERFKREAQAMATTHHANLCPVYDVDEHDGMHFLTMAYIEGKTLTQTFVEQGQMSQREVVSLVYKLALAVHAAHQANVIHRDLKPANIIINNDGEPVIMDFGLARLSDEDSGLTEDGLMLGTPAYMSPEQVKGRREDVSPATDIYSLGAMMYEMLSGRLPFDGTIGVILEKIVTQRPVPLSEIVQGIDERIVAVCLRTLEKEPRARFASAKDFADALRAVMDASVGLAGNQDSQPSVESHHRSLVDLIDRVRSMWTRGEYSAALPVLEAIASVEDPEAAKYSEWARQELPKVRQALVSSSTESIAEIDIWNEEFAAAPARSSQAFGSPMLQDNDEPMPGWILWLIPIPAIVILLLAFMFVTSNPNQPKPETATATNPGEANSANDQNPSAGQPDNNQNHSEPNQPRDEPANDPPLQTPTDNSDPEAQPADIANELIQSTIQNEPEETNSPDETVSSPTDSTNLPEEPASNSTDSSERIDSDATSTEPSSDERPRPDDRPAPPEGRPGPPPNPPRTAEEMLSHHDKNGDNVLTNDEMPPQHRHHILRADSNRDGKVTKAELTKFMKNSPPPPHPPKRPM